MASGVYKIVNAVNGRLYIGSAVHLANRWTTHRRGLRNGTHRNCYLQRAWNKYGEAAFSFVILEEVPVDKLIEREQVQIDSHKANGKLYNLSPTAGSVLGTKHRGDRTARMVAKNTGKLRSLEQRAAISAGKKRMFSENPELVAKFTEQLKRAQGLIDRDKQKAAVFAASKNRVWSDESRAKLSASCMGRRYGQDVIDRIAASKNKPVLCVTTGARYKSVSEAAQVLGLSISGVSSVCRGRRNSANHLCFQFI